MDLFEIHRKVFLTVALTTLLITILLLVFWITNILGYTNIDINTGITIFNAISKFYTVLEGGI